MRVKFNYRTLVIPRLLYQFRQRFVSDRDMDFRLKIKISGGYVVNLNDVENGTAIGDRVFAEGECNLLDSTLQKVSA